MLAIDSLVTDLNFAAGDGPDPEALLEALGGEEAIAELKILDPDMQDPRFEMQLSPSRPFRRRNERRLMIIDDSVAPMREDPETQPIMARLKSDLVDICNATLDGTLGEKTTNWDSRAALGVVMAAGGYPGHYAKGKPIRGLQSADSDTQKVFHAGTAQDDGDIVTSGGRVLCVVGLGDTVADAAAEAYESVRKIDWEDVYFRRDIGHRAIAREG